MLEMIAANTYLILIFIIFNIENVKLESCTTLEGTEGICIPFRECQIFRNLISKARQNETIRNYLKQTQCKVSNYPYVCCPLELTKQIKLPRAADGTCGRSFNADGNLPTRIFGGEDAHLGEFPWIGLLGYLKPGNRIGYHCGATIITSQHVLSAAHCSSQNSLPFQWTLSRVRIGELDFETESDCEEINSIYYCGFPAVDIDIERIIIHNQYSSDQPGNPHDIAIIKLQKTIEFNEFVKPICLPLNKEINTYYGSPTVVGFGRTEESESSTKLKKAEVDIVSNRICAIQYKPHSRKIHSNQICAGRENTDACSGDSGGGLFKQSDNSPTWYMIGIVSFGPRKCASDYPGVYVSIKDYIDWIKINVEERN